MTSVEHLVATNLPTARLAGVDGEMQRAHDMDCDLFILITEARAIQTLNMNIKFNYIL